HSCGPVTETILSSTNPRLQVWADVQSCNPEVSVYTYAVSACVDTQCSPYTQDSYEVEVFSNHRAVETRTTYIHTDALRSPVAETNPTGAVPKRYTYEPYGAPASGTYEQGPGYTGHVADALTGLSYMQQRYYDPIAGRFLGTDPIAASPASFNRYAYANNNPYRYIDPDGRQSYEDL